MMVSSFLGISGLEAAELLATTHSLGSPAQSLDFFCILQEPKPDGLGYTFDQAFGKCIGTLMVSQISESEVIMYKGQPNWKHNLAIPDGI